MKTVDLMGIFLMETKIDCSSIARVMKKIGFSFFISIPPIGRSGGLAFCWRPGFRFQVLSTSQYFFHLEVEPGGDDPKFLCSLVYGPVLWREKELFWQELRWLGQNMSIPWLCVRDFNDLVRQSEKQGGRVLSSSSSRDL